VLSILPYAALCDALGRDQAERVIHELDQTLALEYERGKTAGALFQAQEFAEEFLPQIIAKVIAQTTAQVIERSKLAEPPYAE
jgi:hypothetical protein